MSHSPIDPNWLGQRAPRYTSYPPATAFTTPMTDADQRARLAELPVDQPISLYLHVPFCRQLCLFCGCHTMITSRYDRIAAYVHRLQREITLTRAAIGRKVPVAHVHFGGGSPDILSDSDMAALMAQLRDDFDILPDAEIAIELDPRIIRPGQVEALAKAGFNRVSLGIQTFDPEVQQLIGRVQPFPQIAELVADLRAKGLNAINMDLIYGLPRQSVASIADTVEKVIQLAPARISLFSYAHVPWMRPHQQAISEADLPKADDLPILESTARSALLAAGYVAIGIDHFAKPEDPMSLAMAAGRLHRNFQGYTTDAATTLIGFGPSAIGRMPGAYVQSVTAIKDYAAAIDAGHLPVARGCHLGPDDHWRADVIEQLMCHLTVDLDQIAQRHALPPIKFQEALRRLSALTDAGVISWQGHRLTLAIPQRMAIRAVATAFDAGYGAETGRFSKVG